jgi:hypothetical protein
MMSEIANEPFTSIQGRRCRRDHHSDTTMWIGRTNRIVCGRVTRRADAAPVLRIQVRLRALRANHTKVDIHKTTAMTVSPSLPMTRFHAHKGLAKDARSARTAMGHRIHDRCSEYRTERARLIQAAAERTTCRNTATDGLLTVLKRNVGGTPGFRNRNMSPLV